VKQQVLAFIRCLHGNLEGYDSKDFTPKQIACPIVIDDFVERPGLETNIELSFSTHFTIETQRLSSLPHRIKKCSRLKENKNLKTMKKKYQNSILLFAPKLETNRIRQESKMFIHVTLRDRVFSQGFASH
ncbi:hypothetical protein HID58_025005, partial [Brassica napus]